jgi:hypothetical protein
LLAGRVAANRRASKLNCVRICRVQPYGIVHGIFGKGKKTKWAIDIKIDP